MAINDREDPNDLSAVISGVPIQFDSSTQTAARSFLSQFGQTRFDATTIRAVSQGFSGARVYRCHTPTGNFAIKRWSNSTTAQRMDEVHEVQRFASKSLEFIPRLIAWQNGQTRLTIDGSNFDCSIWRDGEACREDSAAKASLVGSGAAAIARFHQETLKLGVQKTIAPAVLQRIARLEELNRKLPVAWNQTAKLPGNLRLAADFLARNWRTLYPSSMMRMQRWSEVAVPTQWVLRDVHREHVLFTGGSVSGMVDFDAIRRDTVATDLARWVGSLACSETELRLFWDVAWTGYETVRSISPCEKELAGAIETVSRYIQMANWVIWIAIEDRSFPGGMDAVDGRVAALLRTAT